MIDFERLILEVSGYSLGSFLFPDTSGLSEFKNFDQLHLACWKKNDPLGTGAKLPKTAITAGAILYAFLSWCYKTKKTTREEFLREYDSKDPISILKPSDFPSIPLDQPHDVYDTGKRGWYKFHVGKNTYEMPITLKWENWKRPGDVPSEMDSKSGGEDTALDKFIRGAESMMGSHAARFASARR